MTVIYETRGRAREYFELAINVFNGCTHGCTYCYAPTISRMDRADFHAEARERNRLVTLVAKEAAKLAGEPRHILLSFLTDPYQSAEAELYITAEVIRVLKYHGLNVAILTKAGPLAIRDMDLLESTDRFGVTLTFTCLHDLREFEPNAGTTRERLRNLTAAHSVGIRTFASFEPVVFPRQSHRLMRENVAIIDDFLVGRWNYDERANEDINWTVFATDIIGWATRMTTDHPGKTVYLKRDLARAVGQPEGIYISDGLVMVKGPSGEWRRAAADLGGT
jgi:DNA repair photolyase